MIAFPSIASFASSKRAALERCCELCSAPIGDRHRHIVEVGKRGVMCACEACGLLFANVDANTRYRTVPDRVRADRTFALTAHDWASLGIPVGVAFCYREAARAVICYPGPAGIVDAEVDPATWDAIAAATPLAATLEPDVEALLVRGVRGQPAMTCYLVPITAAYELVGRLRASWRGFSGGDDAERELDAFFAGLDRRGGHR
jgi:hypothetical protein